MPETLTEVRPGFQGSETSWFEVTFYRHGDDPVVVAPAERLPVTGRRAQDPLPCLTGVTTSKGMGAPSGSFVIQIKPSRVSTALFDQLIDDDWVDIVAYRHDQPWLVMRGLIDEIRRQTVVSGSGATTEMFTITGRDFGKIWEITPVWFSPYANDIVTQAVANKVFEARPEVLGNPGVAVEAYLKKFLEAIADADGPNWILPPGIPSAEIAFLDGVKFQVGPPGFKNIPSRKAFNPGFMNPSGTLWSLAQQFCDPMFTEFYVDMLPDQDPLSSRISAGDALPPKEMGMTVVLRDKPFPVSDFAVVTEGWESQWADLPILKVPRQQIASSDLGRSGMERFNAYFVATILHQELMGANAVNIIAPLLDRADMQRHGFRRMDAASNMAPDETALEFSRMAEIQRRLLRDWYVLNPYMLNGTITLGIGRPDIRIGCRVRVPATVEAGFGLDLSDADSAEENYYVEQVDHTWTYGTSIKTNLGVTRGWRGDDASYLEKLDQQSGKYKVPKLKTDAQAGQENS